MRSIPNPPHGEFITDTDKLLNYVGLKKDDAPYKIGYDGSFPLKVSFSYADRIVKQNWYDPLLLQILPREEESEGEEGFTEDPLKESSAFIAPGVLQKYSSRILVLVSPVCSVHCRFCFRRNCQIKQLPQDATWRYIRKKKDIDEVILSGGDPLCLSKKTLFKILGELVSMEHLRLLRIHTRVPVSLPSRIDNQMLDMLSVINEKKTLTLVIHSNHPQELQNDCSEVLKKIRNRGILVLNQSVLLKGINDSVSTLRELSLRLIEHGIVPYYLHQLDRVKGGSHFEVSIEKGKSLVRELLRCTCGYGLPKYVQEIPGESSKIPL